MTKQTYRVTIETLPQAWELFWDGVALGVLTYVVLVIAFWLIAVYWADDNAVAKAD